MKYKILGLLIVLCVVATPLAYTKASTIDDVMAQIKVLQQQVSKLQAQASALALSSVSNLLSATKSTTPVAATVVLPTKATTTVKSTTSIAPTTKAPITSSATSSCMPTDPPSITVLSPNGGETYVPGQHITVTWDSCNIPANALISIAALDVLQGNLSFGLSVYTANDGSEVVTLPLQANYPQMLLGNRYKVYVDWSINQASYGHDVSDNLFAIGTSTTTSGTPKVYRALISQTGTNSPTVDAILENTTGGNITYSRFSIGRYYLSSSNNAFTLGKTFAMIGNTVTPCNTYTDASMTAALTIGTMRNDNVTNSQDDYCLNKTPIEVLIYP